MKFLFDGDEILYCVRGVYFNGRMFINKWRKKIELDNYYVAIFNVVIVSWNFAEEWDILEWC